jgi:hypothetical protein
MDAYDFISGIGQQYEFDKEFLKEIIKDVNEKKYGISLLCIACAKQLDEVVDVLLEYENIDINFQNKPYDDTALHIITRKLYTDYLSSYLDGKHMEDILYDGLKRDKLGVLKKIYKLLRNREEIDLTLVNTYGEPPNFVPYFYRPWECKSCTMDDYIDKIKEEDMINTFNK